MEKKVKYFIVEKQVGANNLSADNFVIIPIEHFEKYFDVSAVYRCKKSGSSNPTQKDFSEIKTCLNFEGFTVDEIFQNGKYVFAKFSAKPLIYKISGENHVFQFKPEKENIFKVTKLSKTCNPNVIFSIKLIKEQDCVDLENFKSQFI